MTGHNSTLQDEIKKSQDHKKREKFKFATTIIVTNIMVALLCLPHQEEKSEVVKTKITHQDHQTMLVPLTALLTQEAMEASETPITIMSKTNKLITSKAYLHELVRKENDVTYFKIEIKSTDVVKLSDNLEKGVVAVPYIEKVSQQSKMTKGSKYEVSI